MKKKFFIVLFILILLCLVIIFVISKPNILGEQIDTIFKSTDKQEYVVDLQNQSLYNYEIEQQEIENFKQLVLNRENASTSPGTPFYSLDGWSSNFIGVNDTSATIEVQNLSNETILIDDAFVMYLGVNEDDSPTASVITEGDGELLPGEITKITVTKGGDAKYLKVGFGNRPKDWAFYPVKTFMERVSEEGQLMYSDNENSETYELEATISPHKFKKINIGTIYSRKIKGKKYNGLQITNQEKKDYPYITLGTLKIDIYNKQSETITINGVEFLYKNNNKIVDTNNIEYSNYIYGKECKILDIPFKYYGNGVTTTIILKTSIGNITIHNPDLLFAVIQAQ